MIKIMMVVIVSVFIFLVYDLTSTQYQQVDAQLIDRRHDHTDAYYQPRYDDNLKMMVVDYVEEEDNYYFVFQTPLGEYIQEVEWNAYQQYSPHRVFSMTCGRGRYTNTIRCH